MKNLWSLLLLVFILGACGGDEEEPILEPDPVSGMIEGKAFDLGIAIADESPGAFDFDIYSNLETVTDSCTVSRDQVRAFFSAEKILGKVDLFLDPATFSGLTITLFDPDGNKNNIAAEGFYEILEITESEVKVFVNARSSSDSMIEGEFTATICE